MASTTIASENFISHYNIKRSVCWATHFANAAPLDVEIGFGLGEFLIRSAQENPRRNFVGIEHDWQRVHKALGKVEQIKNRFSVENLPNLRFLHIDAWVAFERLFEPKSIHRLFALFPCPWPKKKHTKHRLFSRDFLKLINSRLVNQGEMKIVTDHEPFVEWVWREAEDTGFGRQRGLMKPQFDTKFERKWRGQGKEEFFVLELLKEKHIAVPLLKDCSLKVYSLEHFKPERFSFPNIIGETSIILKEFLFDPKKDQGMIHLVVAEKNIAQHLWLMVFKSQRWSIAPAVGQAILPTQGIAAALEAVYQAATKTF